MKTLPKELIKEVTDLLKARIGRVTRFDWAVMDDNDEEMLLITVTLSDFSGPLYESGAPIVEVKAPPIEQLNLIRAAAIEVLGPRMPHNESQYSWMVTVHIEKQIDAVMGGWTTIDNGGPV